MVLAYLCFWSAVLLIFYTYVGFVGILAVRAWLMPKPVRRDPTYTPNLTLMIAAYNEADVISAKLNNALAQDYPTDKLQIIVASDGSSDDTVKLVQAFNAPQLICLDLPRQGKNRTLNQAITHATGDVLVFTDADSMLGEKALRHLVAPLADATIGGVGGDYFYATDVAEGSGERTYWGLDRVLKTLQSRAGSMTSATGQLYGIRRELFRPVPDGVTDDFYCSTQAPSAQLRLVFEPQAQVYGPVAGAVGKEYKRKVRVMTRGLNSVWQMRHMLNPMKYGFYAVQLFTHKILRRLMAIPLLVIFISSWVLVGEHWFYLLLALGQTLLHGMGIVAFFGRHTALSRIKPLNIPLYFQMVNVASLVAVVNVLRGRTFSVWEAERTTTTPPPELS